MIVDLTDTTEAEIDGFVKGLAFKKRETDAQRRAMAKDIVDAQPLADLDVARRFAAAWIETAAQHCSNECYWRERALVAEAALPGGE